MARLKRKRRPEELVDPLEAAIAGGNPREELITELIEKNIPDLTKIHEVEKHELFDARQSPSFYSAYDQNRERHLIAGTCSRSLAEKFALASRWFAWRKFPELAATYRARAIRVHEILSEEKERLHR